MRSNGHFRPITLDSSETRVFDDAFHVSRDGDGYVVKVGFPRVEDLCPHGSSEDRGARRAFATRGPETMFPKCVAARLSLSPHEARDAFVVTIRVASNGSVDDVSFGRTRLTSAARLDYADFRRALTNPYHPQHDCLAAASEVATLRQRMVYPDRTDAAADVVNWLMRLTNEAMATTCASHDVRLIYTSAEDGQTKPRMATRPVGTVPYAWFNAPIRRYVDVVNQRVVEDIMDGASPRYDEAALDELCVELREVEREMRLGVAANSARAQAHEDALAALARGSLHIEDETETTFMMAVRAEVQNGAPRRWVLDEALRRHVRRELRADSLLRLALVDPEWASRLVFALESAEPGSLAIHVLRTASEKLDWDLKWAFRPEGCRAFLEGVEYPDAAGGAEATMANAVAAMVRGVLAGRHPSLWTPPEGVSFEVGDEVETPPVPA